MVTPPKTVLVGITSALRNLILPVAWHSHTFHSRLVLWIIEAYPLLDILSNFSILDRICVSVTS